MHFGELVEPSTRSLWDDELTDISDEPLTRSCLEWNQKVNIPSKINTILIGETKHIISFLRKCFLGDKKPLCECSSVVSVYSTGNDCYIILYNRKEDVIVGEITQLLIPWLSSAVKIYTLTSAPSSLFQGSKTDDSCIIRCLSTIKAKDTHYSSLEMPNLVTGLGASVLSYSVLHKLPCILFVAYLDEMLLDSISAQPLLDLTKYLKMRSTNFFVLESSLPMHNLYM